MQLLQNGSLTLLSVGKEHVCTKVVTHTAQDERNIE